MKGTAGLLICVAFTAGLAEKALAQSTIRDTAPPPVSAESESWYRSGAPIAYGGLVYYLAGPKIHFIPSEMVRTGEFRGVPLYARTTIEPNSMVFVPLDGGLMQPYELRRDGDLAGTVGSSVPSLPVALASEPVLEDSTVQTPGPPQPEDLATDEQMSGPPQPTGTSGALTVGETAFPPSAGRPQRTQQFRRRPDSPNGIFVQYHGARWFSSGSPVAYDSARFVRSGEKDGIPIYRDRDGAPSTIYVPVVREPGGPLAPYTKRDR